MKKTPMRKCVACQEMKPKRELLRVVRSPEKDIEIDLKGKKSGRGAYICYNKECLQKAQKRRSLEKALEISISEDLYTQIQIEIEKNK